MTRREVILQGGPPWGFRITGGADQHHPLKVTRGYPETLKKKRVKLVVESTTFDSFCLWHSFRIIRPVVGVLLATDHPPQPPLADFIFPFRAVSAMVSKLGGDRN